MKKQKSVAPLVCEHVWRTLWWNCEGERVLEECVTCHLLRSQYKPKHCGDVGLDGAKGVK